LQWKTTNDFLFGIRIQQAGEACWDMAVITCTCGTKVRLPEGSEGQRFRCPKCRAVVEAPVEPKVLASYRAEAGGKEALCPICQSGIVADEPVVVCPTCDQVHHEACWQEIGGCSTYGCDQAPALAKEAPAAKPLTAWGDTKTCPACGETIKSIALRCRYCKTEFDTVDPLKPSDLRRGVRREESLQRIRTATIVVFIFSLIGCFGPIMLIVSMATLLPQRHLLAKAGPIYQVLGYSAIGLSVLYSVMIVLFLVFNIG
jgi:hypothetical protein